MTGNNIREHKTKGNVITSHSFSNIGGKFARCGWQVLGPVTAHFRTFYFFNQVSAAINWTLEIVSSPIVISRLIC